MRACVRSAREKFPFSAGLSLKGNFNSKSIVSINELKRILTKYPIILPVIKSIVFISEKKLKKQHFETQTARITTKYNIKSQIKVCVKSQYKHRSQYKKIEKHNRKVTLKERETVWGDT